MSIIPGNFIYRTAIPLQSRVFLIPWVKRSSRISSSKGEDYSTAAPVRYIPKKSLNSEESDNCSSSVEHLQGKGKPNSYEPNACRVESLNIRRRGFVPNGKYHRIDQRPVEVEEQLKNESEAAEYEFMEEPEEAVEELNVSQLEDSDRRRAIVQDGRSRQDVENLAIELLATRALTAAELKKKLQGKKLPIGIVDAVISDFQNRGLINDRLYAETFSRSRWSSSSWGPHRIKQALFKKGVSKVDAENAINLVFKDDESFEDQDSGVGMSKLSMDHLFVQVSKQWQRSHAVPRQTQKGRVVRWLQYRGFSWSVINLMLRRLESEYPP